MGASLPALLLTQDAKSELERLRNKRSTPVALATRAEMILLAAAGHSNADIARRLRCQAHVVGKWRQRFSQSGLSALADRVRSGRPVTMTERETKRVVMAACRQPRKGLSRWSVRTLAQHLDLPPARVQRILQAHDLHPHRLRTFTFSSTLLFLLRDALSALDIPAAKFVSGVETFKELVFVSIAAW